MLDFTYVDDCVGGVARGLERLVSGEIENHTINLAFGQGNSLVNMAHYIGEALGIEPDMTIQPSRVGEVTRYLWPTSAKPAPCWITRPPSPCATASTRP